jgi:hypothetical protein
VCGGGVQYNLGFYLQYLATWPEYCTVAADPTGRTMAYSTHHLTERTPISL